MRETPRYQHNCANCIFICRYKHDDVYICVHKTGYPGSFVLRHSDDPSDYSSYPLDMLPRIIEEWREVAQSL